MNVSPAPPPPFQCWGTGPTGGVRRPGSPRSQRRRFVCTQIPGAGGGENGGVTKDEVLAGTLCFGVRSSACVFLYPALEGWGSDN